MAKAAKAKTKATTTKKAKVTKKPTTTKRVTTKKTKAAPAQQPFLQVKVTDQTLYWLIFGVAAILFAMWVYTLDAKVRDLYDQIDQSTYESSLYPQPTTTEEAKEK